MPRTPRKGLPTIAGTWAGLLRSYAWLLKIVLRHIAILQYPTFFTLRNWTTVAPPVHLSPEQNYPELFFKHLHHDSVETFGKAFRSQATFRLIHTIPHFFLSSAIPQEEYWRAPRSTMAAHRIRLISGNFWVKVRGSRTRPSSSQNLSSSERKLEAAQQRKESDILMSWWQDVI